MNFASYSLHFWAANFSRETVGSLSSKRKFITNYHGFLTWDYNPLLDFGKWIWPSRNDRSSHLIWHPSKVPLPYGCQCRIDCSICIERIDPCWTFHVLLQRQRKDYRVPSVAGKEKVAKNEVEETLNGNGPRLDQLDEINSCSLFLPDFISFWMFAFDSV